MLIIQLLTPPKELTCRKCDSTFENKFKLKEHMKANHMQRIKCKVCDDTFSQTYQLETHLKSHNVETFNCDTCEKTFH